MRRQRAVELYPSVMTEFETLDLISQGKSIGRLGDGEFNHLSGRKNISQIADPQLTAELIRFVRSPPKNCLVGLPTMDPEGPKHGNWIKYKERYASFLDPKRRYASAFITRPDNAPWINTAEFYDKVQALWQDQDVTLVANGVRSLKPDFLMQTGAKSVHFVQCSFRDSYAQIRRLEIECISAGRLRVLMCCGPTATVLAARLAPVKIGGAPMHAIDLGHIGMFWRPYLKGKHVSMENA